MVKLFVYLLSSLHDSRNENYVLFHLALLVFTLTVAIPINLKLTNLPFPIPIILFAIGFFSLFMIARNEKVGLGLISILRFHKYGNSLKSQQYLHQEYVEYEKMSNATLNYDGNYQEPLVVLENFVDKLNIRHKENMDLATQDSFRILSTKLSEMRLKSNA